MISILQSVNLPPCIFNLIYFQNITSKLSHPKIFYSTNQLSVNSTQYLERQIQVSMFLSKLLSPSSCHPSFSVRLLMPASNPEVQELLRLASELKHCSSCCWLSSSIEASSVEMLCWRASASIPELLVEWRDRPGLLSLPGGSRSRSSLMYDSL